MLLSYPDNISLAKGANTTGFLLGSKMSIKNCKHCGDRFVADESWKTICVPCYIKMKKAAESPPEPEPVIHVRETIPDDMLMRIIRLCHPDRHQNSESSTIATKWLLDVRTKQAGK